MQAFQQATPDRPGMPSGDTQHLRWKLCTEEAKELGDATNLTDYLDAVLDLLYVVHGSAIAAGLDANTLSIGFQEVHRSNMSKLWTHDEIQAVRNGENVTSLGDCSGGTFDNRFEVVKTAVESDKRFIVRRRDGKIIKSPSYSPANLKQFLPQ
jgi:predicted HAD superfamily Cof-like phosphohydrolase